MALLFANGSGDHVDLGTSAFLRGFTAGTILARVFPTTYPPASNRYLYCANQGVGFRNLDVGGGGGTLGPRFFLDRATVDLNVSVLPSNLPHNGVNTWQDWAVVFNTAGADGDQHMYGGNPANSLTEVTTYNLQLAGTGAVNAESTAENPRIGSLSDAAGGFPGAIAWFLFWNRTLSLAELLSHQHRPHGSPGLMGYWNFLWPAGSTQPDLSGRGGPGTVTGATAYAHAPMGIPFGGAAGWRGAFTAAAAAGTRYVLT